MAWKIRYFDYPMQFNAYRKDHLRIIDQTLSKGEFVEGKSLREFEENLARFIGAKYAIGVGNCTEALLLSLYAIGISPGDEVITSSHAFVATVEVIRFLGGRPVLVDIASDHNMNVDLVEPMITAKTKVLLPVHLNGRVCDGMERLVEIARKHSLVIIEDAAQAIGARYKGRSCGTFGLAGCFSFYPGKLLGAFGDAGAVVTNDRGLAERLKAMRDHGRSHDGKVMFWGLNCRMDCLHAAILNFKLERFPHWIERRREIAKLYHKRLSKLSGLTLPPPPDQRSDHYDVFQNYELEAETRDELICHLNSKGIEVGLPWGGKALHQFPILGLKGFKLKATEELFKNVLMLPIHNGLKDEDVEYVARSIKEFYRIKTQDKILARYGDAGRENISRRAPEALLPI